MATATPNILLIVADDLGVDTLRIDDAADTVLVQLKGTAAYPLPNLSRLVSKGIHFTRAWAHPVCSPTRATLFTGLHPWRHTVGDPVGDPALPPALARECGAVIKTLANVVADAGYRSAILGKWDLGGDVANTVPTVRGWHRHEGILAGGLRPLNPNPPNRASYEQIIQQDVRYVSWRKVICDAKNGIQTGIAPEVRTYKYATEDSILSARDWIAQQQGPWWTTLALMAPHVPHHVAPKGTYTIQFQDPLNPTKQEMFVSMMEAMDHYLGQLFADPQIQNQLQNTVIIFMGDNGTDDELDDTSRDDKASVYIGGVHVPLLIADGGAIFGDGPCFLEPSVISSEQENFVHIVDLFQTIIDIAGGHSPTAYKTDSTSLLPYLKGSTNKQIRNYTFSQYYVPNEPWAADRYTLLGERATISNGTYKLNYQHGTYEFSELRHDPATDQTVEIIINNFEHPKAKELWQVLTTPGSDYYAEVNGQGKRFPPLPQPAPQLLGIGIGHDLCYRQTLGDPWINVPNSETMLGITVLPDGKLVGLGMNHDLWYRNTLTSDWIHIPNSGTLVGITALPDGKLVGIGMVGHSLWYRDTLFSDWIPVPDSGMVLGITALPNGAIVGLGLGHDLWYRNTLFSNWNHVPNSGTVLEITALPDGKIVGLGVGHDLWYRDTLFSNWNHIPYSGTVLNIAYGGHVAMSTAPSQVGKAYK